MKELIQRLQELKEGIKEWDNFCEKRNQMWRILDGLQPKHNNLHMQIASDIDEDTDIVSDDRFKDMLQQLLDESDWVDVQRFKNIFTDLSTEDFYKFDGYGNVANYTGGDLEGNIDVAIDLLEQELYEEYRKQWDEEHEGEEYEGMEPACFDEWHDNEYQAEEGE